MDFWASRLVLLAMDSFNNLIQHKFSEAYHKYEVKVFSYFLKNSNKLLFLACINIYWISWIYYQTEMGWNNVVFFFPQK